MHTLDPQWQKPPHFVSELILICTVNFWTCGKRLDVPAAQVLRQYMRQYVEEYGRGVQAELFDDRRR